MTAMRRTLQRGVVLLTLVTLLAAACRGDTTADDAAAPETAPPATVEETTTDSVTPDTAPPPLDPSLADSMMLNWVRRDCRPWATQVNPEYPIPGAVTDVAVTTLPLNLGSGVMIAIEEDPGIVLLHYGEGQDIEIEQAPPFNSEEASTGDAPWHPVDEASADYLGLPPDRVSNGWEAETVGAMKACLASIQNWNQNWETRMTQAAEAMGWMADAFIAVGDADSPAAKSATCAAHLADPEKERAMDALDGIPLGRGTIGEIRDTFHLIMISCKDGHFEDTAKWERANATAREELSETLDALGYAPGW